MTNLSSKTRKQLVLDTLRGANAYGDGWVSTSHIASKEVGGSEGLRRLRDLRADGYNIEKRHHPNPDISQFQYHLIEPKDWQGAPAPTYTPPKPKITATITSSPSVTFEEKPTKLPWVFWKPGLKGTFTADHLGCDMWVSPAVSGWVWRASSPTAFIAAGTALDKGGATEQAIGAVVRHMEGL